MLKTCFAVVGFVVVACWGLRSCAGYLGAPHHRQDNSEQSPARNRVVLGLAEGIRP